MPDTLEAKDRARSRFDRSLQELRQATIKEPHIQRLLNHVDVVARTREGIEYLYEHIGRLIEYGVFEGTPWADPDKLVPSLVGGTLKFGGPNATIEMLSELRMLAYAVGDVASDAVDQDEANDFLERTITENLDVIFGSTTEESRIASADARALERASLLFQVILDHIPLEAIKPRLTEEIEMVTAQRPIVTTEVRKILELVRERFTLDPEVPGDARILQYLDAIYAPTPNVIDHPDHAAYRSWIGSAEMRTLKKEAKTFGQLMNRTGLVSEHHAILLQEMHRDHPELLEELLGLDATGEAELEKHLEMVQELIEAAIFPATSQSIYGLGRLLERGLLSRQPVEEGLYRLLSTRLHAEVRQNLLKGHGELPAKQVLLAGTLSVLGQPLGVGQGMNPTCQAARGISLWSQHAPGKLLNMIITAAETNNLDYHFEGAVLLSSELQLGLAKEIDYNLDPVSIVLVPHLDRIYNEMMRRAGVRGEDPHKYVNPALYGHWIHTGFCSAFSYVLQTIHNYEGFIRTFYASHHPHYNGGYNLVYPNPVGIFITSNRGDLLGYHAVSLLRVDEGPNGDIRCYFLNPNNEGRQDWGQEITPTVFGNGEVPGESSLPFEHFAARLYAFHYNELHLSEPDAVSAKQVAAIEKLARESWGRAYVWSPG